MRSLHQQLMSVRPALRQVAPLTHAICWGYAVINIGIGLGMMFLYETTVPIAVANILSYPQWGGIFLALGLYAVYALLTNKWAAIALIFRVFEAPPTIIITLVWLFFAFIQGAVYVYFLPTHAVQGERDGRQ
jgi:hypothetical protein